MLFVIPAPVAPIHAQVFIPADATIPPSTALVDLVSAGALALTGQRTRILFNAGVSLSGTTNTLRTGTFSLLKDGVVMRSVQIQLPADVAAAGVYKQTITIELEDTPTAATHTYKVQWSTSTNATLAIAATSPAVGYGVLIVEEIQTAVDFIGPTFDNMTGGFVQANDPKSLAQAIRDDFTAKLTINAGMMLVDFNVEGAGSSWQAILFYIFPTTPPGPVAYPALSDLSVAVAWGIDPQGHGLAIANIFDGTRDELVAWSGAGSGLGAVFLDVFLFIGGEGGGPGLAARIESQGRRSVVVGPKVAKEDRRAPALEVETKGAPGVTFPKAMIGTLAPVNRGEK